MIKSIWIEIRPALRCCHFCVVLSEEINSEVRLRVKKTSLVFDADENVLNVHFKDFTVEPLTMRDFKSKNRCLSFRIQAECDFKFERHLPLTSVPPTFEKDKEAGVICRCYNPLTCKTYFERVLPLPTSDFSFSDLFCHFPIGLQPPSVAPRPNDCFYSDEFLVVSEGNLRGCTRREKFLKCDRCLSTVGTSDRNAAKFYISCINLPFDNRTPSEHLKRFVQKAISNPVTAFPKILLECEENETYLSLVVVDKNLVVSSCEENLILKNNEVVKLKYKFHSHCDSDVKVLKEDPFNSLHQVHKSLIDFSTKFLISCSKTIPPLFSKMENECMAYLIL